MLTPQAIDQYLQSINAPEKILVAYSGGLDSHVLLHLFSALPQYRVSAMHIHHGLLDEADAWVKHCEKICSDLNIPLQIQYLNLQIKQGESLEEVARTARYRALKKCLQEGELLVTAHHQNDQTETLLLQLFRGAGVNGLAAMPSYSSTKSHARPLLSASRKSLELYAKEQQLEFIEDPSNQDNAFDRNFLRNQVLPLLRKHWVGLDKAVNRSASIQAETKQILDEVAASDLQWLVAKNNTINLDKLVTLSEARQKLLIRYWITQSGFLSPSEKKLMHIFSDAINADEDAQPLVEFSGAEIRRFQNRLFIMSPLSDHDHSQVLTWDISTPLKIDSLGLELSFAELGVDLASSQIEVRFRQGGEKIYIAKRKTHISLKNLMQEQGVPPWMRSRLPLIVINNEIVKIVGLA